VAQQALEKAVKCPLFSLNKLVVPKPGVLEQPRIKKRSTFGGKRKHGRIVRKNEKTDSR
jgi:hypothetical protein